MSGTLDLHQDPVWAVNEDGPVCRLYVGARELCPDGFTARAVLSGLTEEDVFASACEVIKGFDAALFVVETDPLWQMRLCAKAADESLGMVGVVCSNVMTVMSPLPRMVLAIRPGGGAERCTWHIYVGEEAHLEKDLFPVELVTQLPLGEEPSWLPSVLGLIAPWQVALSATDEEEGLGGRIILTTQPLALFHRLSRHFHDIP